MERLRQWNMKDWPAVTEISVGNDFGFMLSTILFSQSTVLFLKCSQKYIHEEGQMDSAKLTFLGLKVTERQFTCSIKWGGIVLNDCEMLCWWQFAFHAIRNCLYCCKWDLQSVLLNTISNYADSGAIRAHVSKLVGGVCHWVVDWLFYPILWKPLRRIHSRQNLYSNYRLTEFVFNSFPLIGPSCVSSSLPACF